MTAAHVVTIGPTVAQIVDSRTGLVSPLPKPRTSGYRARCTCGWRSAECATEAEATVRGQAHVRDAGKAVARG